MPRRLLILLLFCMVRITGYSSSYEYSGNCAKAYESFLSLHFQEGRNYLAQEAKANPGNLMAVYIADYEDCVLLLLNCSQEEYNLRKAHFEDRLNLLENGERTSPWYRLCKAGLYLHWAIINVRFGDQYRAAINFRKSFSLSGDNKRLFPQFAYNDVFGGLEEAMVGSLPGSYKWLASLLGMKGNIKEGDQKIEAFINTHTPDQPLYSESVLYHLYVRFYLLARQREVWNFLNNPQFDTHNNLLNVFVKTNIGLDFRKTDEVVTALKAASGEPEYSRYPIFDYLYGAALLTRLDTAAANYLQRYLTNNKSDILVKDAWQKTAFAWYVNGNMARANYSLQQVAKSGSARIDADKQALRFAENKMWPAVPLLQARLLIEGGYYTRALTLLTNINPASLSGPADNAEFYFRLGRAYEELADSNTGKSYYQQALAQYGMAVAAGRNRHEQFAARAMLHTGKIFERLNMKTEAISKYKECLDMPAHDFQNSIDQQAKAGINRIEGAL